jgi:hypothetical protein
MGSIDRRASGRETKPQRILDTNWTESRLQEQLPPTLIRLETATTSGTVSASSPDSSTTDPELRISRAELNEPNRRSMSQSRTFRVLVVAPGANPTVVYDALTAVATIDRRCVDEVHVLTSADTVDRLSAALLKPGMPSALANRCRRLGIETADIVLGRRAIHGLGSSGKPGSIADDVLDTLRQLCGDPVNEVTVVASSEAGVVGVLAHSALQLVGELAARFFVLDVGPTAEVGSEHRRPGRARMPRPTLSEVPIILAERPMKPGQSYTELVTSRRLARRRLFQPGKLTLDGRRRAIRIDDVELPVPRLQFFWMFCLATLAPKALPLRLLCGNFDVQADGRITIAAEHPQRAQLEAHARHIKRVFVTLFPEAADEFPLLFKRACGPTPGLPSAIAKLNAHLKRALGVGAEPYLIAGGRGSGGYRLTLLPAQIELVPHVRGAQTPRQRVSGLKRSVPGS